MSATRGRSKEKGGKAPTVLIEISENIFVSNDRSVQVQSVGVSVKLVRVSRQEVSQGKAVLF